MLSSQLRRVKLLPFPGTEVGRSPFCFGLRLLLAISILHCRESFDGTSRIGGGRTMMTKASSTPTPKMMKRPFKCRSPQHSWGSVANKQRRTDKD